MQVDDIGTRYVVVQDDRRLLGDYVSELKSQLETLQVDCLVGNSNYTTVFCMSPVLMACSRQQVYYGLLMAAMAPQLP